MNIQGKRGQIAIYVIIALAILVVFLAIMIYPRLKPSITESVSSNPQKYLDDCLSPTINDKLSVITAHGGEENPVASVLYKDEKIKYLCYTSEYYKTCTVQDPFVKDSVESRLNSEIQAQAEKCVDLMVQAYQAQGYKVTKNNVKVDLNINPDSINVIVNAPMTVTKDSSRNYKSFEFTIPSKYYEILFIANSIVEFESTFGDADTLSYIKYYPDEIIQKDQMSDGTVIYTINNTVSKESFRFASRSLPWPPGGYLGI